MPDIEQPPTATEAIAGMRLYETFERRLRIKMANEIMRIFTESMCVVMQNLINEFPDEKIADEKYKGD